jgi:hypothetical protein
MIVRDFNLSSGNLAPLWTNALAVITDRLGLAEGLRHLPVKGGQSRVNCAD